MDEQNRTSKVETVNNSNNKLLRAKALDYIVSQVNFSKHSENI